MKDANVALMGTFEKTKNALLVNEVLGGVIVDSEEAVEIFQGKKNKQALLDFARVIKG